MFHERKIKQTHTKGSLSPPKYQHSNKSRRNTLLAKFALYTLDDFAPRDLSILIRPDHKVSGQELNIPIASPPLESLSIKLMTH